MRFFGICVWFVCTNHLYVIGEKVTKTISFTLSITLPYITDFSII